jgi:hypothetical protein
MTSYADVVASVTQHACAKLTVVAPDGERDESTPVDKVVAVCINNGVSCNPSTDPPSRRS